MRNRKTKENNCKVFPRIIIVQCLSALEAVNFLRIIFLKYTNN